MTLTQIKHPTTYSSLAGKTIKDIVPAPGLGVRQGIGIIFTDDTFIILRADMSIHRELFINVDEFDSKLTDDYYGNIQFIRKEWERLFHCQIGDINESKTQTNTKTN